MPDQWNTVLIAGKWHVTDGYTLILVRHGYLAANGLCGILNMNQCEVIYPDGIRRLLSTDEIKAEEVLFSSDELRDHLRNAHELDNL